jgi:hypothetical protein
LGNRVKNLRLHCINGCNKYKVVSKENMCSQKKIEEYITAWK